MLDINTAPDRDIALSDGTLLSSLIDRERREVSMRMLNDPEIYELELQHLWSRVWTLVGHESEIPSKGDFITRRVGADTVILVRQTDGSIKCLLNSCPHRGMQVCRNGTGNAAAFKCIYHGWIFNRDGSFRGAPFNNEMYPDGFDAEARAMVSARVELFGGLIFVNWDETAPGLDEFLGEIGSYLRLIFDRTSAGFEVMGAPQRYIIDSNWKCPSEQAVGDGYHGATLHRSLVDMGVFGNRGTDSRSWGMYNYKVSVNGHGLLCHDLKVQYAGAALADGVALGAADRLRKSPPPGMFPEQVDDFVERFGEETALAYTEIRPGVGLIFPNIHVIAFAVPDPAGGLSAAFGIHSFVPCGPDKFEMMHWNFIERGASPEFRDKLLRTSVFNAGASGVIEQDDSEVWPGMQISARGAIARRTTLKYHAVASEGKPADWPLGGGTVYGGFNSDDNQWNWWNVYFDYLTGAAGRAGAR